MFAKIKQLLDLARSVRQRAELNGAKTRVWCNAVLLSWKK